MSGERLAGALRRSLVLLLIIRDLMIRGYRTFKEFQQSGEGIASNILARRLRNLEATGIITAEAEKSDGQER